MPLFDSEFLKKLEYLSLVSRRVFRGQILAQRRTMQLGGGIEFADHRDYTPGDDFRYLDWNAYARHGELLLKRCHEEEDLHVYILLDRSRSRWRRPWRISRLLTSTAWPSWRSPAMWWPIFRSPAARRGSCRS